MMDLSNEPEVEQGDSFDTVMNRMIDGHWLSRGFKFLRTDTVACPQHGDYAARIYVNSDSAEDWHGCPVCAELKTEYEQIIEARAAEKERRKAILEKAVGAAAIPPRFENKTLDNYEAGNERQGKILAFCRAYAENFAKARESGISVIFSGGVGTGKTHLSIGIAKAIIVHGYSAHFTSVSAMIRRVRASWRSDSETEIQAMALFSEPDLLIIDEVGLQSGSENEHQILFDILNSRYENCLPTILITNLPLRDEINSGAVTAKGLQSYIGDRLLDRLREGGGKAFTFDWQSARGGMA